MAKNDGPRTVCAIVTLLLLTGVAIALLFLGALHLDDCARQKWIPKFMIVGGILGLVMIFFSLCGCNAQNHDNHTCIKAFGIVIAILLFFNLVWNILGSVWVFAQWKDWDDFKNVDMTVAGCHNGTYLFAFIYLILFWISVPLQIAIFVKGKNSDAHHV